MKKYFLHDLKEGMITAEDVFSIDRQLVVPKGVALTENLIAKLYSFDILSVRISDEVIEPTITKEDVAKMSNSSKMAISPEFLAYKEEFSIKLEKVRLSFNSLFENIDDFNPQEVLNDTLEMINHRSTPTGIMDILLNMQNYDDCTYAHSLNVAMLCNIIAGWLRFSEEDKELATACGLFHDVGKMCLPPEIINKPSSLTPDEMQKVQTHPLESYKMISKLNLPEEVKNAALMHHERCDGSGYPYGFTSEKISRFAKLVSIADVYEAMTSRRTYREAICPFSVITHFENEGISKYDPEFLFPFLENVVNTFINQKVKLSNGLIGDIIFVNPVALSKPTIKIGSKYIDLKAINNLDITKIL